MLDAIIFFFRIGRLLGGMRSMIREIGKRQLTVITSNRHSSNSITLRSCIFENIDKLSIELCLDRLFDEACLFFLNFFYTRLAANRLFEFSILLFLLLFSFQNQS